MAENKVLIQYGHVESTDDALDGMRIKVRLNQDRVGTAALPFAFPLLPKTIQSMPKRGEGVLVFTMEEGNNESQRFYLGPIISQPQYFNYDKYYILGGKEYQSATSLLKGAGDTAPKGGISTCADTKHAFPEKNSISIVGRDTEDIELKEGEIDIRCGIRKEAVGIRDNDSIFGKVIFNNVDPAYIQLKYNADGLIGGENETRSIANIIAGKINLVSTNDPSYSEHSVNWEGEADMLSSFGELMDDLHQVPWGDKLIQFLDKFRKLYAEHTHPNPLICPFPMYTEPVLEEPLEELLSKDVRVS